MFRVNPNGVYIIRIIAGGYLIFMAYQLAKEVLAGNVDHPALSWFFVALFIVAGVFFIGYELRRSAKEKAAQEAEEVEMTPKQVVKTDEELLQMSVADQKEEEQDET